MRLHLLTKVYPSGRRVRFEYDPAGRRIAVTDNTIGTIRFAYDNSDNLVKVVDMKGRVLLF